MHLELIFFAIILAGANFLGQRTNVTQFILVNTLKSLSAGFSTAYVFLILLPELLDERKKLDVSTAVLLLPVLVGFSFFHVVRKYLSQSGHKAKLWNERVHLFILVLANFGTAYVALELLEEDLRTGAVLVGILALHMLLTDIVGIKMAEETRLEIRLWEFVIAIAPIVAGLISVAGSLPTVFRDLVFALTIGAIIYIALREEIPEDKAGRPIFFALGVLAVIILAFAVI